MTYYPRNTWSTVNPNFSKMGQVTDVFIHHTATAGSPKSFSAPYLRNVEYSEMNRGDGLIAIAYHKIVFANGDVAEGRPWGVSGGATFGRNSNSVAICAVGYFYPPHNEVPTQAAIDAIGSQIAWAVKSGYVSRNFNVLPHSAAFATACPGTLKNSLAAIKAHALKVLAFLDSAGQSVPAPTPVPAPAPAPPKFNTVCRFWTFKLGSKGACVKTLQNILRSRGYSPGTSDGVFGEKTKAAVICFQVASKLKADGIVGPNTWKALLG